MANKKLEKIVYERQLRKWQAKKVKPEWATKQAECDACIDKYTDLLEKLG